VKDGWRSMDKNKFEDIRETAGIAGIAGIAAIGGTPSQQSKSPMLVAPTRPTRLKAMNWGSISDVAVDGMFVGKVDTAQELCTI